MQGELSFEKQRKN